MIFKSFKFNLAGIFFVLALMILSCNNTPPKVANPQIEQINFITFFEERFNEKTGHRQILSFAYLFKDSCLIIKNTKTDTAQFFSYVLENQQIEYLNGLIRNINFNEITISKAIKVKPKPTYNYDWFEYGYIDKHGQCEIFEVRKFTESQNKALMVFTDVLSNYEGHKTADSTEINAMQKRVFDKHLKIMGPPLPEPTLKTIKFIPVKRIPKNRKY